MLPIVATLLAQGLGTLANAVVNKGQEVIEEKLGVKLDTKVQTPEGLQELKQLEIDHEEFLINAGIENRKIDLDFYREDGIDRRDARDANVQLATNPNASFLNQNLVPILALVTVGACLVGLLYLSLDTEVRMALVGLITMVLQYYFGSSSTHWKMLNKGDKQ